ncbi:PsbP domain-containing protein 1, chloroplastic [Glycine soja]|uniref:PsbP domain-containing protein 1, chloroplastic n=1 Tax=Glycine soja TaxID=3848 RepID=A0A445FK95_GLYSO|nr:PsbP domain-containing protein 1, chloroplastic [Glycine soja]
MGFSASTHYPYDAVSVAQSHSLLPLTSLLPFPIVPRRKAMSLILSSYVLSEVGLALAQQSPVFREYIDAFDGCSFQYPGSWIQVRDLGAPQEAGKKVLKQYLTEFMSTRLGVRRESNILSTSSRVTDDGRLYYQIEVNIKSYANNNELAVMPEDRVVRLEWDPRYLSVLGVENNQLYELRLQVCFQRRKMIFVESWIRFE